MCNWCKHSKVNIINGNWREKGESDSCDKPHSGRSDAAVNEDKDKQNDDFITAVKRIMVAKHWKASSEPW